MTSGLTREPMTPRVICRNGGTPSVSRYQSIVCQNGSFGCTSLFVEVSSSRNLFLINSCVFSG